MSTKHEYGYTHAPCILSALKVIKVECVAVSSQNDCQGGSDIYNRTGPALYGYRITVSEPLGATNDRQQGNDTEMLIKTYAYCTFH